MQRALTVVLLVAASALSVVPFLAWVGLGVHRHASPIALTVAAMLLVYVPPVVVAVVRGRDRPHTLALSLAVALTAWSFAMFTVLPVYFPGERRQAVATGLGRVGLGAARFPQQLAANLPDERTVATPEVAEAEPIVVAGPLPATPLSDDQIALPYEGEGRRLSVPVIFGNHGRELELEMMFDTGATYTTLSTEILGRLGVRVGDTDPRISLHTANGDRDAAVVLLDHVWLGDLRIDGVAIAVCDDCASTDNGGLLGLNVAGGFNVSIDADRREVVFTRRATFDRKLDLKPFTELTGTFTRYPGGRVEVSMKLDNRSRREIASATASVRCGSETWTVDLGAIGPGELGNVRRKLPEHETCEEYEIGLHEASW